MPKIKKYYEGVKLITKSGPVIITDLDKSYFTFKFLITGNEQTFPRSKLKDTLYPDCTDNNGEVYEDWLDRFDYFREEIVDQIDEKIKEMWSGHSSNTTVGNKMAAARRRRLRNVK